MKIIFNKIKLKNANIIDNEGCSALTYAAQNGRKKFYDYLFINNIDIENPKADRNGIIQQYRNLLSNYEREKKNAKQNYEDAIAAVKVSQEDVDSIKEKKSNIEMAKLDIKSEKELLNQKYRHMEFPPDFNSSPSWSYEQHMCYQQSLKEIEKRENSLRNYEYELETFASNAQEDLVNAKKVYDYYERNYESICHKSREDILKDFDQIENLAKRSKEIGIRKCIEKKDSGCCIF